MKKYNITVNGKTYEVEVEEITNSMHNSNSQLSTNKQEEVKKIDSSVKPQAKPETLAGTKIVAPMPGKIFKLLVSEGDNVEDGQVVAVIEAMKMENEIVSPAKGKVHSVNVELSETVNSNDVIMVIGL